MSVITRTVKGISRRDLLWGAGGALGGAVVAGFRTGPTAPWASGSHRVGTVVDYDQGTISVRFDGSDALNRFPYLASYLPCVGERVLIVGNGLDWFVVGAPAGIPPDNPVTNGGFETGNTTGWTKVDLAGATTLAAIPADPPAEGYYCGELSSAALTVDTVILSNAIHVHTGDHWSADCMARCTEGSNPGLAIVTVALTWYANATNLYPTTSASDTFISQQTMPTPQNIWGLFRIPPRGAGSGDLDAFAEVPANTTHMRVAIRCFTSDPAQVPTFLVDRVVARHLESV